MPINKVQVTDYEYFSLVTRLEILEREVEKLKSHYRPTIPIYEIGDFPPDAIEGQVAIFRSSI